MEFSGRFPAQLTFLLRRNYIFDSRTRRPHQSLKIKNNKNLLFINKFIIFANKLNSQL